MEVLISGQENLPFFFKIVLTILGPLHFHNKY